MKKRILIVSIIVLIIFISIMGMNYNTNNTKAFTQDGVTYALTLDGASVNNFPSKGMYRVDVECTNATGKWLYDEWKLAVENINGTNATCDVDFVTINKTYINTYITSLSRQTQGDGQVVNENGYRYEGKNPNNYVWFNNELWRIIGVFDSASHGQSGKNLVKIIRVDSIGGLAWHKSDTNDWTAASLMNLLNGAYLNAQNGTDSGYCYGHSNVSSVCDYTIIGINSIFRSMIANVTWYLGGYSSNSATTAEAFYGYERGTTVYSGRPTEWEGKIGLMYPSDYGYSVLSSSCARTTNLSSYNTCAGESWLYLGSYEWTLTPNSSYSYCGAGMSRDGGLAYCVYSYAGYSVRPVLYLDSSVYVIDGNGTMSDPYIIGM